MAGQTIKVKPGETITVEKIKPKVATTPGRTHFEDAEAEREYHRLVARWEAGHPQQLEGSGG
jgi:hypothetical protein